MAFVFSSKAQTQGSTANPVTVSCNIGAGSDLLVATIHVTGSGARTGGVPTLGGTDMIQAGEATCSDGRVELWYILNEDVPNSLGVTLSVPNTGTAELTVNASWYTATNHVIFQGVATNSGTGTGVSVTTPTLEANLVAVDGMFHSYLSTNLLSGNRTQLYIGDTGDEIYGAQYHIVSLATPATYEFTWTARQSDVWCSVVAAWYEQTTPDIDTIDGVDYFNGRVDTHDSIDQYDIDSKDSVSTNL